MKRFTRDGLMVEKLLVFQNLIKFRSYGLPSRGIDFAVLAKGSALSLHKIFYPREKEEASKTRVGSTSELILAESRDSRLSNLICVGKLLISVSFIKSAHTCRCIKRR